MLVQRRGQQRSNVRKTERVGGLVAIALAHSTGKGNHLRLNACGQQAGLHQPLRQRGERAVDDFDDQLRHPPRHLGKLPGAQRAGAGSGAENRIGNHLSRLMRVDHAPLAVGLQQATADVEAGGAADFAGVKQGIV